MAGGNVGLLDVLTIFPLEYDEMTHGDRDDTRRWRLFWFRTDLSHRLDEGGHNVDADALVKADGASAEQARRHLRLNLVRERETTNIDVVVSCTCMSGGVEHRNMSVGAVGAERIEPQQIERNDERGWILICITFPGENQSYARRVLRALKGMTWHFHMC